MPNELRTEEESLQLRTCKRLCEKDDDFFRLNMFLCYACYSWRVVLANEARNKV